MSGPRKRISITVALVILTFAAFAALKLHAGPVRRAPPEMTTPVRVGTAKIADVPVYLSAIGSVLANYTATVTSRVDGVLEAVYFTEGQKVEKGQLLAQIDPRAYQATLQQYQGALEENKALLHSARLTLDRYRQLYASDSLARQDLDSQIATVGQYEGAVKTDQAQIDSARLNLQYARITAPIAGYAGLRLTDPGNMVHSTDTTGIVTLTQSQPIAVTFSLPEANLQDVLPQLRQGQALPVEVYDRQRSRLLAKGTVKFISNEIDSTTGSVKLKAMFGNADGQLYPNQFVNVKLQTGTLTHAVIVPSAAIQLGNDGSFLYQVNANATVSRKKVSVGPTHGDWVVVNGGLAPGSRVVTAGIDHLHDGARVEAVPEGSSSDKGAQ